MTQTDKPHLIGRLLALLVTTVGALSGLVLTALLDAKLGVIVLLATAIVSSVWTSVYQPSSRRASMIGSALFTIAIVLIAESNSLG